MNGNNPRPLADVAFAAVVIVFAAVIYWGTLDLPPPRYEPMGSAALPRALAVIMSLLALIVGARGLLGLRRLEPAHTSDRPFRLRPVLALAVLAVLVVYLLLIEYRLVGFISGSIPAFGLIGCMLVDFDRKRIPGIVGFMILLVLMSYLVFTKFFYIDLP